MNWYKLYKQAEPLPVDIPPEEGWQHIGAQEIYRDMNMDTVREEFKKRPGATYLGSGSGGVALEIGNNRVIKYTQKEWEANAAEALIGNTRLPVAKVYSVSRIQSDPNIWAIEMEKVKPYTQFVSQENDPMAMNDERFDYGKWRMDSKQLMEDLFEAGLSWDVNQRNVGYNSEGKLVLFDLEPSRAKSNERRQREEQHPFF